MENPTLLNPFVNFLNSRQLPKNPTRLRTILHTRSCPPGKPLAALDMTCVCRRVFFNSQHKELFWRNAPDAHPERWCLLIVTYCILMQAAREKGPQAAKLGTWLLVPNPLCHRPQAARAAQCTTTCSGPRTSNPATSIKRSLRTARN